MKPEEIKTLMSTIKALQSAIETTKGQLLTNMAASAAVATSPTIKNQQPVLVRSKSQVGNY